MSQQLASAQRIAIVYCVDRRYIEPMLVSATSLLKNLPDDQRAIIYVLHQAISDEQQQAIRSFIYRLNGRIKFIAIKRKLKYRLWRLGAIQQLQKLKQSKLYRYFDYFNQMIFYRLLLEHILPEDRVIYLDADTVVAKDITPLWQYDLGNDSIGAVADTVSDKDPIGMRYNQRIDLQIEHYYVNSGVLLLDLKKLRKNKAMRQLKKLLKGLNEPLLFPDQDMLNMVYQHDISLLPPSFNTMIGSGDIPLAINLMKHDYLTGQKNPYSNEQVLDAVNSPTVIHYLGKQKPWHFPGQYTLHKEKYWHYYNFTPKKTAVSVKLEQHLIKEAKISAQKLAKKMTNQRSS